MRRFGSRLRRTAFLVASVLPLAVSGIAIAAPSGHATTRGNHVVFKGTRSVLTAAQVRTLSAHATDRSIIILRNQLSAHPAARATTKSRMRAASEAQAGVMAELSQVRATHVHSFAIIDAIAATISPAEAARLRANPAVQAVVPDAYRRLMPLSAAPGPISLGRVRQRITGAAASVQQICPSDPAVPIVEPEARQVLNANAADAIVDGAGVKVGIIADGIDPNIPDLIRSNAQHVIFDYRDFSGFGPSAPTDGREAFLEAGTIASQGNQTYDLSGFVNPSHPLPPGCNIKIEGIAPGASLAVMNVAGPNAGAFSSQIIQAIQWAVMVDHVNVLTESSGENPVPNTQNDPVARADKAAVAAGVTVVAGGGDAGPFNNIGSPATTPGVIAVGGTTTYRLYRQTTRYGTQLGPGGWENNNIAAASSSGTNEFGPSTVTVVAPGDSGWSLCSSDTSRFFGCADIDHGTSPPPIWAGSGTGASAAETAATAALVIEAYGKTHSGTKPSPTLVKRIIVSTATSLGAPANHQGAGLVNSLKAVRLAESINAHSRQGRTLLIGTSALTATVAAGRSHTFGVKITNEGAARQRVTPTVSGIATQLSADTGSITLNPASPTYIDGEGNSDFYAEHQFTVPTGANYLNGNIAWNAAATPAAVFETLFDPTGRVAAYSMIGTDHSGFGHVEVRKPMAGTWTAVIFTVNNASVYSGLVTFNYFTQKFHRTGLVSPPSAKLAPGQSRTFSVTVRAGRAGGESLSLRLGTGSSTDGSVPILLRSLIPIGVHGGSFSGTLTGAFAPANAGQSFTYRFDQPRGKRSLNVGIRLANSNFDVHGFLVDPNGQPVDIQSTDHFDAHDNFVGFGKTMQFFRSRPQHGRWTLTLLVSGPIDGSHMSVPFRGAISFAPPRISSTGLPHSARKVLKAGHPITATVTVTNTGNIRKDFFADARLDSVARLGLLGSGVNNVPLPLAARPDWFVPTGTRKLLVAASGTVPITMDVSAANGDPDVLGTSSDHASIASLSAPEIAPGVFFALPEATGPFTATTTGTVNLTAIATTHRFDAAVSADSGDVWALSVNSSATYSPLSLGPGQKGTITLTITPNAPKGTVVHGYIAVDTFDVATFSGDELVKIPYTYKVG